MHDSKLLNLLKKFTPGEFKEIEKFVASPYFGKGRDLLPLLKTLKPFYPEFNDKKLNSEFIFSNLFPGRKFDTVRSQNLLKTLFPQLFKLCINFLTQLEFNEDENRKEYYLLNQLRGKKLYKEFDKVYQNSLIEKDYLFKGSVKDFTDK